MLANDRVASSLIVAVLICLPAEGQGDQVRTATSNATRLGTAAETPEQQAQQDTTLTSNVLENNSDWKFTVSPYLWMMSLSADVEAGPVSTSADACFTDLLKNLELGGSLRFEGMHDDRWGFYLDGTYLNLGDDGRARVGPFRLRGLGVDVDFIQAWLDAGGIYRFGKAGRAFDLMLGARYTYTSTDVSLGPLDRADSNDFVTPVIGGRMEYALSPKWIASIKADAGGFGVDDAADLVWGITALLGYRLSDKATVGFGYRYYDIDFSGGRLDTDVQYHGPLMGLSISF